MSESVHKESVHKHFVDVAKLLHLISKTEDKRLKGLIVEKLQSILRQQQALFAEMAEDGTIDEQMYLKCSAEMMESFNHLNLVKSAK